MILKEITLNYLIIVFMVRPWKMLENIEIYDLFIMKIEEVN